MMIGGMTIIGAGRTTRVNAVDFIACKYSTVSCTGPLTMQQWHSIPWASLTGDPVKGQIVRDLLGIASSCHSYLVPEYFKANLVKSAFPLKQKLIYSVTSITIHLGLRLG